MMQRVIYWVSDISQRRTTYIFEYYRNGTGFTVDEMKDYFSYIDRI